MGLGLAMLLAKKIHIAKRDLDDIAWLQTYLSGACAIANFSCRREMSNVGVSNMRRAKACMFIDFLLFTSASKKDRRSGPERPT